MAPRPLDVVSCCLQAYVDKDRDRLESLIADDYRFTSPLDNGLDRRAYFEICWPNSQSLTGFDIVRRAESGDRAFVVYEGHAGDKTFRNCEVHTVRDGKLVATEVYFGWDVPHEVRPGEHRQP